MSRQKLESNILAEHEVFSTEDLAHPSFPQETDDPVALAEHHSRRELTGRNRRNHGACRSQGGGRIRLHAVNRHAGAGVSERLFLWDGRSGFGVMEEQFVDFAKELFILIA